MRLVERKKIESIYRDAVELWRDGLSVAVLHTRQGMDGEWVTVRAVNLKVDGEITMVAAGAIMSAYCQGERDGEREATQRIRSALSEDGRVRGALAEVLGEVF